VIADGLAEPGEALARELGAWARFVLLDVASESELVGAIASIRARARRASTCS
jgi:hypothetical protein